MSQKEKEFLIKYFRDSSLNPGVSSNRATQKTQSGVRDRREHADSGELASNLTQTCKFLGETINP